MNIVITYSDFKFIYLLTIFIDTTLIITVI